MEDNQYFQEALGKMTAQSAYGDAVLHLHKKGLSPEQIREQLLYPASIQNIERVIADYENRLQSGNQYDYVQDTDSYGRRSFRRVRREETREQAK